MKLKDRNKPQYEWIEINAGEVYYSLSSYWLDSFDKLNGHPGIRIDGGYRPIRLKIKPKKSFKVLARKIKNGYCWSGWKRTFIKIDYDIKVDNKKYFYPTHSPISLII